jgi:glycosyltransferase involved in cell wall biosynthesis
MNDLRPVALIPAYKPEPAVVDITLELARSGQFQKIVVVNDGSGPECEDIFKALEEVDGVELLRHHVNLGKGAALKSGFNHVACRFPGAVGVVTLDADGQHLVVDVLKVAAELVAKPHNLILGSREFQRDVPLRSRFGNLMTRGVMRVVGGLSLRDTQTGLRGIPMEFFAPLLRLKTQGYDFELDMLLKAKEQRCDIIEVPIQTVYIDENQSSHFNPFVDSLKIYLVFLRFNLSSLLSVVIDYSIFSLVFTMAGNVFASQFVARFCAGAVNYYVNRSFVFKSDRSHKASMAMYFTTLVLVGIVSYGFIQLLHTRLGINLYMAKILSEGLLYVASFTLQREFIFTRREKA